MSAIYAPPLEEDQIRILLLQPAGAGAYHALHRLRQLGGDRVWIDAICIDRRNDAERSQQVSIMANIYAAAQTVFV